MKLLRMLSLLIGVMLGVMAAMAQAPSAEFSMGARTGPKIEFGATPFTFEKVLGTPKALRIWAGAGSEVREGGNLSGSFAALVGPFDLATGLGAWPGIGYIGQEGEESKLDAVVHFRAGPGQTAALRYEPKSRAVGVFYSRRF